MSEELSPEDGLALPEQSMDMDAITAHLDRGWDLLGRNDYAGARLSASRIVELEPERPEGYTLLGAITAAEGDPEGAMDLFRRALDSDPDYLDAIFYAAELAIHPMGGFR
jgi:Tfp pilus assembly protein PilF